MIVVPDDQQASKKALEASSERAQVQHEDDPPPMYSGPTEQFASTSTTPLERYVPDIKPSNFICVSKWNGAVKGSWVLDPTIILPPALLPPLERGETEETRKNLMLESRNGAVDSDIYILPIRGSSSAVVKPRQRVTIQVKSWNGTVTTKIHDLQSNADDMRLPFHLNCHTTNGTINMYIPRSFQGVICVKTRNGNPRYSEAVRQLIVPISDINGEHRSFLGQFDASKWEGDSEWVGDELHAESWNGSVKVFFEDEADPSTTSATRTTTTRTGRSPGFFGKLFSF